MKRLPLLLLLLVGVCQAQTLTLADGTVTQANTHRLGINIGSMNYYDNGQILKNLIGAINPGFEPLQQRQIWNLAADGSTNSATYTSSSFTVPDKYDGVPANYWAGGTFTVVASQSGGTTGCSGTIASNTGPNYPTYVGTTDPVITTSAACAGSFAQGDIVILSILIKPTPEAWLENSQGGFWTNIASGGKLTPDTTDLCATCGTQAVTLDATAAGSTAGVTEYFDTDSNDVFVLINGTYQISFWAKASSGTPTMTVSAGRGGGFSCGPYTPTLTATWTQYTYTCTGSETQAATNPSNANVAWSVTGGAAYLDNVSFQKTSGQDPTNTTVLRDEVINTLKTYFATATGSSSTAPTLRYWLNQNAETSDNWTNPDYSRNVMGIGTGYFEQPTNNNGISLSLEDYLNVCAKVGADPYLVIPITFTTTDAANLINFLAGTTGTYATRRINFGQSTPWTSVFTKIHLDFGNEAWNFSAFSGQALPSRSTAPNSEFYYDYSVRAGQIFAAMRGSSDFNSAFDLIFDIQTAVTTTIDLNLSLARALPDTAELNGYFNVQMSSYATDAAIWQPVFVDQYLTAYGTGQDTKGFYTAFQNITTLNNCGASGTAGCKVSVYEFGNSTITGSPSQAAEDSVTAGAGEASAYALSFLSQLAQYGIQQENVFSLTEYAQNGTPTPKLWGNVIDMGGATNNVRPTFLGGQMVNQAVIGPMFSCSLSGNPTYNFTANGNGASGGPQVPTTSNVPTLYAYCFKNGSQRTIFLINTDLAASHTVTFSGTNVPTGTVNTVTYAPPSVDSMNEAASGTATNHTAATSSLSNGTVSNPSSVTLSPAGMMTLSYSTSSSPAGSGITAGMSLSPGTKIQ